MSARGDQADIATGPPWVLPARAWPVCAEDHEGHAMRRLEFRRGPQLGPVLRRSGLAQAGTAPGVLKRGQSGIVNPNTCCLDDKYVVGSYL